MTQLPFHTPYNNTPPPQRRLSIIQKLITVNKMWHEFLPHFPKTSKNTLGPKIDSLFVEIIELAFMASYSAQDKKLPIIHNAILKLDLAKFFLQIAWENKSLDSKKYIALSEYMVEIGKMLGGWNRHLNSK